MDQVVKVFERGEHLKHSRLLTLSTFHLKNSDECDFLQ